MRKAVLIFILGCMVIYTNLFAQVVMVPQVPGVGMVLKPYVWNILLTNSGTETLSAQMKIVAKDRMNGTVFYNAISANFSIPNGPTLLNENIAGPIDIQEMHYQLENSGFFPAGYYNFCFELIFNDGKTAPVVECMPVDVEAMAPPFLLMPEDSSVTTNQLPVFIWMPPAPITLFPILLYDLIVVEQYPGQPKLEAIQRNNPVVSAFNLTSPVFPLASIGTQLDTGKIYVWQVIARNGDSYGTKTDAWSFKIGAIDTTLLENHNGKYYIQLSRSGIMNTYPMQEDLAFTFLNETNDGEAFCSLVSITNQGQSEVASKTLTLQGGRNYLHWNLAGNITEHPILLLKVMLKSGATYSCYLMDAN